MNTNYEQQMIDQFPIVDMPYGWHDYICPTWDYYSLLSNAVSSNDVALVAGILNSTTIQNYFDLNDMARYYAPYGSEVEDYLLHNGADVNFLAISSLFDDNLHNLNHYLDKGADASKVLEIALDSYSDGFGRIHIHIPQELAESHYFNGMYENPWQPNDFWTKTEGYGFDYEAYNNYSSTVTDIIQPYIDTANQQATVENISMIPEVAICEVVLA
ncbi:MAG: hypothetical protein JSS50_00060 [Proteobacteria bacterium]|nr:hypothetical protein [Pseudomonadota bacterium]